MTVRSFDGMEPQIHPSAYIDPTALVIGDVTIGAESFLLPYVVVRGDVNSIRIGARTNIQDGSILHVNSDSVLAPGGTPLHIGDEVTIGHRVLLHGCTIGDHCLIGMGATVMDRAEVERDVIVGAGSLVTPGKHLAAGYLYAGQPARQVRELSDTEASYIDYSFQHYSELKARHCRSND